MDAMIDRLLSLPNIFVKHQKMDEDELSKSEKQKILHDLATEKPTVFLTRYFNYLDKNDCDCFKSIDDDFVQSLLNKISNRKPASEREKKNRRFIFMQKLIKDGDYFSDINMREREPYLYDTMIGRFLNENERKTLRPTTSRNGGECTWSGMLSGFEESSVIAERRNFQESHWQPSLSKSDKDDHQSRFLAHVSNKMSPGGSGFIPEEEDDDTDDVNECEKNGFDDDIERLREAMENMAKLESEKFDEHSEDDIPKLLRSEFESFMQQKFLAGKDTLFFDYSLCDLVDDKNMSYIDPIKERDDEERWFDEDD